MCVRSVCGGMCVCVCVCVCVLRVYIRTMCHASIHLGGWNCVHCSLKQNDPLTTYRAFLELEAGEC